MKILLTILLTLFISTNSLAESKKANDEVDYMTLAAILLNDGHYSRANEALNSVDMEDESLDRAKYYTLKGLATLKLNRYKESNENFYKAIESGQLEKSIYIYIAQNSFKLKDYDQAISALESAEELVLQQPKLMALKAECFYKKEDYNNALVTLKDVNQRHPNYYDAYKQRFYYYISLHLYQSALDDAKIYMANAKLNEKVTLSFINALRKSKQTDRAIKLAEEANLRYVGNPLITVLLAHLYIDKDMIQSAAYLFDEASIEDRKYVKESAEMFRRAKKYVNALYKNSQMLDKREKYKQKVAIYLDFGNYEKVVSAEKALKRNGVLEDQNMVYALAYAFYMNGDFEKCEEYLKMLSKSDLFKKAVELRKNMQTCKNNPWECTI